MGSGLSAREHEREKAARTTGLGLENQWLRTSMMERRPAATSLCGVISCWGVVFWRICLGSFCIRGSSIWKLFRYAMKTLVILNQIFEGSRGTLTFLFLGGVGLSLCLTSFKPLASTAGFIAI